MRKQSTWPASSLLPGTGRSRREAPKRGAPASGISYAVDTESVVSTSRHHPRADDEGRREQEQEQRVRAGSQPLSYSQVTAPPHVLTPVSCRGAHIPLRRV